MLALTFCEGDYAFVYSAGRPIGVMRIGEVTSMRRLKLCFGGSQHDFEVLRPRVVERRFGIAELLRLKEQFLPAQ